MEHIPSGEANWFSASQEIPRIVWNPKVLYRNNNNNNAINTDVYQIMTKNQTVTAYERDQWYQQSCQQDPS
jgi:hypothetical protein